MERSEDRRHPAVMILMMMTYDHHVERPDPSGTKCRDDSSRWSRINQRGFPLGRLNQDRVPLAYIEYLDGSDAR